MLKITKDGKKVAVLKDDASEPELVVADKKKDKKKEPESGNDGPQNGPKEEKE